MAGRKSSNARWSARVTETSDALDLDPNVFTWKDPRRIAASLKRSAERSKRRKGTPYQSAMSILTLHINRAGSGLPAELSGGKISVTDGPFTEAKEIVGGYAICECETHEEAVALGREFMELHRVHWPEFEGESEVRPFEEGAGE